MRMKAKWLMVLAAVGGVALFVQAEETRFDAGRLLIERFPSKQLVVEDNLSWLAEGKVPDFAVPNVVQWLELMGQDMSAYRAAHPFTVPQAKPLPKAFRLGYMLDISRSKVPTMASLRLLVDVLAKAGFSELQLYTENTFAYAGHEDAWREWSPMTPEEVRELDEYAWSKGVRLVANQNSFGHLEKWFRCEKYRQTLAEAPNGYDIAHPAIHQPQPAAVCPTNPKTYEFLDGLYAQLLPNFRHSKEINVGCDEVWDIFDPRGRSGTVSAKIGVPQLYINHLKKVHQLVTTRGTRMAFWAEMVLRYPELLDQVPTDVNALQWGYGSEWRCRGYTAEFEGRCEALRRRGIPYTVCPTTHTYAGVVFDLKNAFGNIRLAAESAAKFGAEGLLLTEWGDGGHANALLENVPQIVYAGLLCRNRPASRADVVREIDEIVGVKMGEQLLAYHDLREQPSDPLDWAKLREIMNARLAVAMTAPAWVKHDTQVADLLLRLQEARIAGKPLAPFKGEYSRLWLVANRPGGLEESLMDQVCLCDTVLSNATFRLVLGANGQAKSLVISATGEEMLVPGEEVPFFSVTQDRPFNNELKLAFPNKRTTYAAKRIRRYGDRLIVGFEQIPYEAEVGVKIADGYIAFTLDRFLVDRNRQYEGLKMDLPPASAFRVVQLPVKERANYGLWLNTMHDEKGALAVVGTSPWPRVDAETRPTCRVMYVEALAEMKREGVGGAIVAGATGEKLLDALDALEEAYDLPRGVRSRRSGRLNSSIGWTIDITPANVDDHIRLCQKFGFKKLLIYYPAFSGFMKGYETLGDYEFNRRAYPNGLKDLEGVVAKLRAAGITPGFHTLQTHIGEFSHYVTPVADPRLNLKRHLTLAKPYPGEDPSIVEVFENPAASPMFSRTRVLKFGGELFSYEGYTTEPPYRFTGVKRGWWRTAPQVHPLGEIGGILDVSEYGTISCYIDQRTNLQDEIADKIAAIYDLGFEFCYFDGSEGVNQPYEIYVPLSQYRVCRKFKKMPLFTEGAAKAHFSWHLQAGANAFDVFPPEIFKKMIAQHPLAEAPIMRKDFTGLDFGWCYLMPPGERNKFITGTSIGLQPDMLEYGTSKAAAWDCPMTVMLRFPGTPQLARLDDLAETMRRWEDVRAKGLLSDADRAKLRDPAREFHLYRTAEGSFELVEWQQICLGGKENTVGLRAFVFERGGRRVVAYWHTCGRGAYVLADAAKTELTAEGLKYFETEAPREDVVRAFAGAVAK